MQWMRIKPVVFRGNLFQFAPASFPDTHGGHGCFPANDSAKPEAARAIKIAL